MAALETEVLEHEPVKAEIVSDPGEDKRSMLDPIVSCIPDELWEKVEDEIADYLDEQLREAESERSDFMRNLARWKVVYSAPKPESPKNFPFSNASNMVIPVVKETVNTLAAQIAQASLTVKPRWVFDDLAHEWAPFTQELQEFTDIVSERELNMEEEVTKGIIAKAKYGTTIYEVGHEVLERKFYRYTSDSKKVYPKTVIVKDGPGLHMIPLQKFWIRLTETDIQSAAWVAKEFDFSEIELRLKAAQGEFFNVSELLIEEGEQSTDVVTETEEKIEDKEPLRRTWKCFEVWLSFDVDGEGDLEEIKVLYYPPKRKFLYRRFNPYDHGRRPFVKDGYFPMDGRFYDMGLCEMLEQIQDAISDKHNRRNDNETLANMKMFLKRKMVKGLQPGDPLYPGKQIEVTDIWNDIREFSMSEIYPSTVQEEMILRQTAERLAGTNEGVAGAAMPVTRTGTGAQLALLQEQSKRIDIPVKASRRMINEVGWLTIMLYMQFGTNGKALAWMGERGRIVDAIFGLPQRVVELGLGIKANAPTSMQNQQVKRENSIAMFNLLLQLYEKLAPLAQMLAPQQLGEFVHAMVRSARDYAEDILETFDQPDPDAVLAGLSVLQKVLPKPEDLGGLEAYERGAQSAEISEGIARLESLYSEASAAFEGRRGVADERRYGERTPVSEGPSTRRFEGIGLGGESFLRSGAGNRRIGPG